MKKGKRDVPLSLSVKAIICLCIAAIALSGAAVTFSYVTFRSILVRNYESSMEMFASMLIGQRNKLNQKQIEDFCKEMSEKGNVSAVYIYEVKSGDTFMAYGCDESTYSNWLEHYQGKKEKKVTDKKLLVSRVSKEYGMGVFIEMSMKVIDQQLLHFAIMLITVIMEVTVLLVVFSWNLVKKHVVNPILMMNSATKSFLSHSNEDAEAKMTGLVIETNDEIQILWESIMQMEDRIQKYIGNITEMTIHAEKIKMELNIASRIQASMLPIPLAANIKQKIKLYAVMHSAKEVAGDFYDYFMIDKNHLGIIVADVSGKSIPAALFMMVTKTALKNNLLYYKEVVKAVDVANKQLCEGNNENMFVTAFIAIIDIDSGEMSYCNAGHTRTVLASESGEIFWFKERQGIILGAFDEANYRECYYQLKKRNYLYIYTDGVTEACDKHGEFFGESRLGDSLKASYKKGRSLEESIMALELDVKCFSEDDNQADDITVLGVELI